MQLPKMLARVALVALCACGGSGGVVAGPADQAHGIGGWWMLGGQGIVLYYAFHADGSMEFIAQSFPDRTHYCRRMAAQWLYANGRLTIASSEPPPPTRETFLADVLPDGRLRVVMPDGQTHFYTRMPAAPVIPSACPPFERLNELQ